MKYKLFMVMMFIIFVPALFILLTVYSGALFLLILWLVAQAML